MAANRITQSVFETLDTGAPKLRGTQVVIETLDMLDPVALRVTQVVFEVLEVQRRSGIIIGGAICPNSV